MRVVIGAQEPLFRMGLRAACEAAGLEVAAVLHGHGDVLLNETIDAAVVVVDPALLEPDPARLVGQASLRHRVLLIDAAGIDRPRLLRAGASGFVSRMIDPGELRAAVEAAEAGELVLPGVAPASSAPPAPGGAPVPRLTRRETDILRLLASGHSTVQCALALHLSSTTVKTHLRNASVKLGTSSRTAAAARATELGLLAEA